LIRPPLTSHMDRQQILALLLTGLMLFSSFAYALAML
jgi:uncharacterized membrane protein